MNIDDDVRFVRSFGSICFVRSVRSFGLFVRSSFRLQRMTTRWNVDGKMEKKITLPLPRKPTHTHRGQWLDDVAFSRSPLHRPSCRQPRSTGRRVSRRVRVAAGRFCIIPVPSLASHDTGTTDHAPHRTADGDKDERERSYAMNDCGLAHSRPLSVWVVCEQILTVATRGPPSATDALRAAAAAAEATRRGRGVAAAVCCVVVVVVVVVVIDDDDDDVHVHKGRGG